MNSNKINELCRFFAKTMIFKVAFRETETAGQGVIICDKAKVEVSVAKQSKIRVIAMLLLETLD
ncbi:hypothetical protein [Haemophilus pittmaniae]|uniref:hypothetical protein n=1 Tax=Haemophilus pittmaniae TaxID=249188 RepID=UPI000F50493C|nr:hypothetical protein [Haemophilus pittmaniae]